MNTHRDGGSTARLIAGAPYLRESQSARRDGNRGVRFRPLLSLGVRGNAESARGRTDRVGNKVLTPSNLRGFLSRVPACPNGYSFGHRDRIGSIALNSAVLEQSLINPIPQICSAKTKDGSPCRCAPAEGKVRCRSHGGAPGSGAPSGEKNGRYKHGRYSRPKRAERLAAIQERRAQECARLRDNPPPKTDYAAICVAIEAHRRDQSRKESVR
jgi:hypothetical protein